MWYDEPGWYLIALSLIPLLLSLLVLKHNRNAARAAVAQQLQQRAIEIDEAFSHHRVAMPYERRRADTILLVDDDPIIREFISRTLHDQHYAFLEASNAEDALVMAAQYAGSIDLLLTDVSMPGIGGFQLVDHLTSTRPTMRVLYISGHYLDSPGVRRGLHDSYRRFLLKPFTRDQLVNTVREVLDAPTRDGFDLILANPSVAAEPIQDAPPPQDVPRALRFRARLAMRYCTLPTSEWHDGVTENISRSGVLFQGVRALALQTPLDMFLTLPRGVADDSTRRVRCHGEIVRVVPDGATERPRMAATVDGYTVAAVRPAALRLPLHNQLHPSA